MPKPELKFQGYAELCIIWKNNVPFKLLETKPTVATATKKQQPQQRRRQRAWQWQWQWQQEQPQQQQQQQQHQHHPQSPHSTKALTNPSTGHSRTQMHTVTMHDHASYLSMTATAARKCTEPCDKSWRNDCMTLFLTKIHSKNIT